MDMEKGRKKRVVFVSPSTRTMKHKKRDIYAERSHVLGLTGYGHTAEEADESFQRLLQRFVDELSKRGILEKRLTELGVKWRWPEEDWLDLKSEREQERELATA